MSLFKRKKIKIAVAMSGGVDSSVAAYLLAQDKRYDVVGVYMRNWSQEMPEIDGCPWEEDQRDARGVADQLGIPFYVVNFEKEYYSKVVDYMLDGYEHGTTPNPDIMCNQEIKFGIFLKKMHHMGFDKIATGHYARIEHKKDAYWLKQAVDENKDQTYFLCRLNQYQLSKTLFPIGEYPKEEVRNIAQQQNLITAKKKDSQGICFIGKVNVRDFLETKIEGTPGDIVDVHTHEVLGQHAGLEFFTIGQRQGLDIGGTGPYYVVARDFDSNQLLVTNQQDDELLYKDEFKLRQVTWINQPTKLPLNSGIRIRYRHPIIPGKVSQLSSDEFVVTLEEPQRAVTSGQSAAFYDDEYLIGSGIIK